jgi:ribosomal protein L15
MNCAKLKPENVETCPKLGFKTVFETMKQSKVIVEAYLVNKELACNVFGIENVIAAHRNIIIKTFKFYTKIKSDGRVYRNKRTAKYDNIFGKSSNTLANINGNVE